MKSLKIIVSFVALAVRAWGHSCSAPTPVFNPAVIPAGETQPLELNGYQLTSLPSETLAIASSIYGASGFPWTDCRVLTLTQITGAGTFLGMAPAGSDYLVIRSEERRVGKEGGS